ncbi:hypothetical protein BCR44DRAFT_1517799 [Catenaria anguillulae PL171]|uniref:Ricin B lectin domain-containing protein n=1 Tax=Catenaria anguillulae PL171 TaxID=765915 RepID=A0A1Y2H650_9FUNG|nr:hypothetical protein BCR44DRAFT_1517799 [Catenaria anguillulae PL171]
MWRCNNNPVAQNFDIFRFWVPNPPSNPPYVIRSTAPASGNKYYCLDVAGGNAYEGQSVQWWECNDSPAQFWTVNYEPGGISGRISPHGRPDLCLDPRGGDGGDRDGQPMQLWRCLDNHWVQKWKVAPFGSFACKSRPNNEE